MKLHELLTDESKWTQHAFARNQTGHQVGPWDSDAVCWCLAGGLQKVYGQTSKQPALAIPQYKELDNAIGGGFGNVVSQWNDDPERTFADIRALLVRLDI